MARPRLWLVDIEAEKGLNPAKWRFCPFTGVSRESVDDWNARYGYEYRRFIKIFSDWEYDKECFGEAIAQCELLGFEVRHRVLKRLWRGGGYRNPKFRNTPTRPYRYH